LESSRPSILVVDDESVIANTLSTILNNSGYSAIAAYDGEAAIEMAIANPPKLLITDVVLPGMNGFDLAIMLRQIHPECKVLLFSGQAYTKELMVSPKYQIHQFDLIGKPVHPTTLLEHIKRSFGAPLGPEA
jgi:DNA-binding NtrC family response regulator